MKNNGIDWFTYFYGMLSLWLLVPTPTLVQAQGLEGYYQQPSIHENTIVFVSEGDLWKVSTLGGSAQRLTTHAEEERHPAISPNGKTIAFTATYNGLPEVYTMPMEGGIPIRWTFSNAEGARVVGWTPKGELIFSSNEWSNIPNPRLFVIDLVTKRKSVLPLFQAHTGMQNSHGTWFFVPLSEFNEHVKRYQGGWARHIWRFDGKTEAVKLSGDHLGESFNPMWYENRVYFITDRDGMKNIWSMDTAGNNLKQHTFHTDFDLRSAQLHQGRLVYQVGADLWLLELSTGKSQKINIRLASDFEQLRETWVSKPADYITSVNPSPNGDRLVVTTRGRVFSVPVEKGRTISFASKSDSVIRYRDAVFSADGKSIMALSDASGEFEFVRFAADGSGRVQQIGNYGPPLRYEGIPSPNGKWLAYDDIDKHLYVLELSTGLRKKVSTNEQGILDFSWSPDGQWLAFVQTAMTGFQQIKIYHVNDGSVTDLTNDRSNCFQVKWSPDGKFIYYLSDRSIGSMVGQPRNKRMGGVAWDKAHKVYHVALTKGLRSPFRPLDELNNAEPETVIAADKFVLQIDKNGLQSRTMLVPIEAGNYQRLEVTAHAIYLLANDKSAHDGLQLKAMAISRNQPTLNTLISGIAFFKLTANQQKMFIKKGSSYYMVDAGTSEVGLGAEIDLGGCTFAFEPKNEWMQLYKDAWRMERDYFYDKNMHGVNWDAMYAKYLPLVQRVSTRSELNEVLSQLIGELSVLHAFVFGGDMPSDDKKVSVGSLGALTSRDEVAGGFRIDYIYQSDPDFPERKSPLADPFLDIRQGDVILKINGRSTLSVMDLGELLVNEAGKQVRLSIKRGTSTKEVVLKIGGDTYWLRYGDWQYSNRLKVEQSSGAEIGYVHLSANSDWDIGHFYREYFPVANKKGLIIDMRNNEGGYISSLLLEQLHRNVWMYRIDRTGLPIERVPHMIVLVNERTGSDGEVFAEGFRRMGLGPTLGMRTWGGFVALHFGNQLSDNGVAAAPMHGGYAPEGVWLVEGVGHVPDMLVENLPFETFHGKDAQLEAAIAYLQQQIAREPKVIPAAPAYPNKSFKNNRKP